MNKGAWKATVHGVTGVRHNLATKPPPLHVMHHIVYMCVESRMEQRDFSIKSKCP